MPLERVAALVLILVHTAHPQAMQHCGPGFGRLLSPRQFSRVSDTAEAGIPWAADNDCFQGLDADAYRRMLAAITRVPGCRFVTAPDVVGDWRTTRKLFDKWWPELAPTQQGIAYVLQDGQPHDLVPWDQIDAIFVGGTTEYKLSAEAERLVSAAKLRGLWTHMGRVNSRKRFDYARQIGCDSIDGSKFSKWRNTWLPDALEWHKDPIQGRFVA